ncbi:hypothetical protein IAR50_003720 [Cryptococcus sp. DSM 104548]
MSKPYIRNKISNKSAQRSDQQAVVEKPITLQYSDSPFVLHSVLLEIQANSQLRRAFFPSNGGLPAHPKWKLARRVYIAVYSTRENDLEGGVLEHAAKGKLVTLGLNEGRDRFVAVPTSRWTQDLDIPHRKEIEELRQAMIDVKKRRCYFRCPLTRAKFRDEWKNWADVPPRHRPLLRFWFPYFFTLRDLCSPDATPDPAQAPPTTTPFSLFSRTSDSQCPIQPYIDRLLSMNARAAPASFPSPRPESLQSSSVQKKKGQESIRTVDGDGKGSGQGTPRRTQMSGSDTPRGVSEITAPREQLKEIQGQGAEEVKALTGNGSGSGETNKRQKRILDMSNITNADPSSSTSPAPLLPHTWPASSPTFPHSDLDDPSSSSTLSRPGGYGVVQKGRESLATDAIPISSPLLPLNPTAPATPKRKGLPPMYTPPSSAQRGRSSPSPSSRLLTCADGTNDAVAIAVSAPSHSASSGVALSVSTTQPPKHITPTWVTCTPPKRTGPTWVTCTPPKPLPTSASSPESESEIEVDELMPLEEQIEDVKRRRAVMLAQRRTK